MDGLQLSIARHWFDSYSHSFSDEKGVLSPLLQLKYDHSFRVEKLASRIAGELGWKDKDIACSRAVGVLHDVGRFPQYDEYGTFYDPSSVDHGDLGEEVLASEFPWEYFDEPLISRIRTAVKFHNKRIIPEDIAEETLPFLKIVRDSDKLDVFGVVREHFSTGRAHDLLPGISLEPRISEELVREIENEGSASYSNVSTIFDFLMVQATWVFDINFRPALSVLKEKGTMDWIGDTLSADPASVTLMKKVRSCLQGI